MQSAHFLKVVLPVSLALLGFAGHASAQTNKDVLYTKALVASCANCHGTNGVQTAPQSAAIGLAGLPKEHITAQMQAYKTGARAATVMHQIAKGYSDAQIAQIATYFSQQRP